MKKDDMDDLFEKLHGDFDALEPPTGHRERFLHRLNDRSKTSSTPTAPHHWWRSLAVAASVALVCLLGWKLYQTNEPLPSETAEIEGVSPEITNTQFYFAGLIEDEVKQLQSEETPETKKMVEDALLQLKKLENDLDKLMEDLANGGNQKMILSAMITNYQTRIDLLQSVMQQIDSVKKLNTDNDETFTI